ncbi:MAG: hypothetical protein S0880_17595, partial [Actinomycetota bacterium]|nr:hypothetical protein [Actinomycetota bacterium]
RFTLSRTPHADLESYVRDCAVRDTALIKFILPATESMRALSDLDAMGINPPHLFPDLTGIAEGVTLRAACEPRSA